MADTNTYNLRLSCGCPFAIAIEDVDTSAIKYDIGRFNDTLSPHIFNAQPKTIKSGTYYSHLSLVITDKMEKDYVFHETLRDTLIIP